MKKHFKKAHSEAAKRKAEDSAELARLDLLHTNKVPRLSLGDQSGGAVSTRGMQQESKTMDQNPTKDESQSAKRKLDEAGLLDDGQDDFLIERANRLELEKNPLFKTNMAFFPYRRQGLKGAVKKEQFTVTFDQLRKPTREESLDKDCQSLCLKG